MVLVPLIRMIWQKNYKDEEHPEGRWRRLPEDGFSAEEIAAYYLKMHVKDVKCNPSSRRRKKRRAKSPI
jgi:hypothetical protein